MKKIYTQPSLKVRQSAAKPVLYTTSIEGGGPFNGSVDAKQSSFFDEDSSSDIEWNM